MKLRAAVSSLTQTYYFLLLLIQLCSPTSTTNFKSYAYGNRIQQSYSFVDGVDKFTFELLRIFIRSPYTESVSHRFVPYTRVYTEACVRPPYISIFLCKRSFRTVHIRPGR
jgi:hypothetical protein